jgi:chemosensory pili system protein ChpB (putative protein-glutamate methylesterase)
VPSTEGRAAVSVALVYQAAALQTYLSDALRDLGANVVYETRTRDFERAVLDRSGAKVVIVNLDPDNDEVIDAIDDLLVDDKLKVVFNDGEASGKLSGYDLARWARHLASKIVGDSELLPPRPPGSEAVPVRSMPQHGLSSTSKPKSMDAPSVSDESMLAATDEIANALASFDMHATKVEAKNAPAATQSINDLLGDFGLAPGQAAAVSNPFADLGLELDLAGATLPDTTPDLDATGASPEFGVDDLALNALAPAMTAEASGKNPFEEISFSDAPIGKAASEPDLVSDLLAFADLHFDETPVANEEPTGLDEFLAQHAPRVPVQPAAAPKPAAVNEAPPKARNFDASSLSLESDTLPRPAAATPAPELAKTKEFSFNLDHLSLELSEEEVAARDGKPFGDRGMSFESVLHGARASEKNPSAEAPLAAPAPAAPAPPPLPASTNAPVAAEADPFDFSFDLPELTEADTGMAPAMDATSSGDLDLSADEDAFMREFAAMNAMDEGAQSTSTATGPVSRVWVLGASIGGPDAVREFLTALPASVAAVFVLAQHMGADFVDLMVAQLQKATKMKVAIATHGMHVAHGQVLVVPIAERMLLGPDGEVRVVALDEVSPYSPSIDRVLIDVADRFGASAGTIIFSGMAHDAIEGAKHLAAKGGTVWVQDPSTCVVSSMIDGAMDAGIVGFIGKPAELAAEFARRFERA